MIVKQYHYNIGILSILS